MKESYFNISMNRIGFKILDLKRTLLGDIEKEIDKIERELDTFKEECFKKIEFDK